MQSRIDKPLVAARHRRYAGEHVAVGEQGILVGGTGQREAQSHDQVLVLIKKLISDFNFQKQGGGVYVLAVVCSLVLARLQQIRTVARAINRGFALLAAALRANTPVDGWTEALFFPGFADGAAHEDDPLSSLWHFRRA